MPRSKGAAAALDFFIWGSGHAYLGFRKALGLPWVIWTTILGVFSILASVASASFYYIDYSTFTIGYNYGEAFVITVLPYLVIGGLMIFDLMRKGMLNAPGRLAQIAGQTGPVSLGGAQMQTASMPAAAGIACPSCGSAVAAADMFCPSCGMMLRPAPAVQASVPVVRTGGGKVCSSCGTANPAGYTFCRRCGSKLV
ncbi:MAG: zinc ribbon domain-containing protein [Nitrososphaerota archaeon]|nr:zinc ribbon domain-containing protein [Nitrososphaerota archaeon]